MASRECEEEDIFLKLFDHVLRKRNPDRAPDHEISESIREFVDYFRINRKAAGACSADRFRRHSDCWGYFYWHSPLSAAVTRNKVLTLIRDCEHFRSFLNKKSMKIVSIGGGTGSDLVGFYSAIYQKSRFQDISVHLLDNIPVWKQLFEEVQRLLAEDDFGDASQFIRKNNYFTSYIRADMREEMTPHCEEALRNADLIWMKGFLSTLADDFERHEVTEKVIMLMSRGSLLIVFDSPAYDQFGDFVERQLLRPLSSTDGGFMLELNSISKFRIMDNTNHEIFLFQRV